MFKIIPEFERVRDSIRGTNRSKIVIGHASRESRTILRLDELDRRASVRSKSKFFRLTAQPFFVVEHDQVTHYRRVIAGKNSTTSNSARAFRAIASRMRDTQLRVTLLIGSVQMNSSIKEHYAT